MSQLRVVPNDIDGISFEEIYEIFAKSPYGEKLKGAIRYSPYKPDSVSNEEWIEVLGKDVNNLEHLLFTLSLTRDFLTQSLTLRSSWRKPLLKEAEFDEEEQKLLCLTAVIHDWGESEVGDIPHSQKNSQHEEVEFRVLNRLIEELCNEKYKGLIGKLRLAASIALNEKGTKLSQAFSAIEYAGYRTTALRAWREYRNFDGDLSKSLLKLASNVTRANFPIWQKHALIYPGIHYSLLENNKPIQEILAVGRKSGI